MKQKLFRFASIGHKSQFKDTQQLSMAFTIHSLKIKYKTINKILYHPSSNLARHQLKAVSNFKWNVDKKMIDKFKNWPNDSSFASPKILDNLCIVCGPKSGNLM